MAEPRRVAFLGIGHPLRRDDAAGVEVCERMRPLLRGQDDVLVVSGGSAPENCVGALRAFGPDLVVVIDAARMGQPPGTLLRIDPSDPRAAGASTHTMPLPVFCEYVAGTLGCDVTLLGIEPADTSFGEGLTPGVERAVAEAARQATNEFVRRSEASEISQTTFDPRPHPLPPLRGEGTGRPGAVAERGRSSMEGGGSGAPPTLHVTTPLPLRSTMGTGRPAVAGGGERGGGSTDFALHNSEKERMR